VAAPKRTPEQRESDLATVADLYLRGRTQQQIGHALGVSRQQVSYDLKELNRRWRKEQFGKVDARKAEQLARVDRIEAAAWDGWDKSCRDAETLHDETESGRCGPAGNPLPDRKKTGKTVKGQAGDPRFLERVCWCVAKRCRILGLYAPQKLAPTDPTGEKPYDHTRGHTGALGIPLDEFDRLGPAEQFAKYQEALRAPPPH
jgi:hypothetical protein